MTYLEALRRKMALSGIDETVKESRGRCPKDVFGVSGAEFDCGMYESCAECWLTDGYEEPKPAIFEEVETIYPCTVQILRNPKTGEESIGWFRGQMDG